MKTCTLISAFIALFFSGYADTLTPQKLIVQTITYHTNKASEVYIYWSLKNWTEIPEKQYWPPNTFAEGEKVGTKMNRHKDSFSVTISLPEQSYISFMFWIPVDSKGDSTDGWDTY